MKSFSSFSTARADTEKFVAAINTHIDKMQGKLPASFFHSLAVQIAQMNIEQKNGGPFGAVIVGADVKVIGIGANHVVPTSDPSAHAEMEAYRDAAKRIGASDLSGAVLYASCECCPMCLAGANGSGISRIFYVGTKQQAEAAGFSDRLQYDMLSLKREQLMSHGDAVTKLATHGAVVLDDKGEVFAVGDTDTSQDPTNVASLAAIRAAVKKYAAQCIAPTFSLPQGFTLLTQDIPHPMGLIAADWAHVLRHGGSTPDPARVVHATEDYEQMPVTDKQGRQHIRQDAKITYLQPTLPDEQRAVPTQHYSADNMPAAVQQVFDTWVKGVLNGEQINY